MPVFIGFEFPVTKPSSTVVLPLATVGILGFIARLLFRPISSRVATLLYVKNLDRGRILDALEDLLQSQFRTLNRNP